MALEDRPRPIGRAFLVGGDGDDDAERVVRTFAFAFVQVGGARHLMPLIGHEADVLLGDAASGELPKRGLRYGEVVEQPDDGLGHGTPPWYGRRTSEARRVPSGLPPLGLCRAVATLHLAYHNIVQVRTHG